MNSGPHWLTEFGHRSDCLGAEGMRLMRQKNSPFPTLVPINEHQTKIIADERLYGKKPFTAWSFKTRPYYTLVSTVQEVYQRHKLPHIVIESAWVPFVCRFRSYNLNITTFLTHFTSGNGSVKKDIFQLLLILFHSQTFKIHFLDYLSPFSHYKCNCCLCLVKRSNTGLCSKVICSLCCLKREWNVMISTERKRVV